MRSFARVIAAVGTSFHLAVERKRTGTHLNPHTRSSLDAKDNLLNLIVLQTLDMEVAQVRPDGERIDFSFPGARMDGVWPAQTDEAAIAKIGDLRASRPPTRPSFTR